MKTSKTKSTGGVKKNSVTVKESKNKKITPRTYEPSEEEIREKAMEIYLQRIERDEYGTPEEDWLEAEERLRLLKDE